LNIQKNLDPNHLFNEKNTLVKCPWTVVKHIVPICRTKELEGKQVRVQIPYYYSLQQLPNVMEHWFQWPWVWKNYLCATSLEGIIAICSFFAASSSLSTTTTFYSSTINQSLYHPSSKP